MQGTDYMIGRKMELGHVLMKLFVINPVVPDLSDVAPSHRAAWPLTAFTERYCIKVAQRLLSPQSRCPRLDQMLVISEPVSQRRGRCAAGQNGRRPSPFRMATVPTIGVWNSPHFMFQINLRRSSIHHVAPSQVSVTAIPTAFYRNRYRIKVRPNGLLRSQSCVCADVRTANCAFPSFLQ
jgi:hypothetical protein